MADAQKRLSPEEYAAEKARKKDARKQAALKLIGLGCPGVLTMEQFTMLLAEQLDEQGILPRTFASGAVGYMTNGKLAIKGHRFQTSIMLTMIKEKGSVPTHDEVAELEALSEATLDQGERV